jgi:hypothetical protein
LELLLAGQLDLKGLLVGPYPYSRRELWIEPTARLYEASTYAICHTPAALAPPSAQLPASAEALLSGKQRTVDYRIGWSSDPTPGGVRSDMELAFPSDCFEVTAAEASTLYQILDANGMINHDASPTTQGAGTPPSAWTGGGSRFAEIRGQPASLAHISSEPIYPHGQPVFWGG